MESTHPTPSAQLISTENLIEIPECDVPLIAGDISFAFKGDLIAKQAFPAGAFREWLEQVPAAEIVLVAGNHDQSIEAWGLPDGFALPLPPRRRDRALRPQDLGNSVAAVVPRLRVQRSSPPTASSSSPRSSS